MRFYKQIENGYISSVGTCGRGGTEVSEAEYKTILEAIHAKPEATGTTDYRLREDLTWEAYEVEPPEPEEDELGPDEVLDIIFGGGEA